MDLALNSNLEFQCSYDNIFAETDLCLNKMAYTAKDPHPPTAFSVPNRNKKLKVGRNRKRSRKRRRKCQSEDPRYHKGAWVKMIFL